MYVNALQKILCTLLNCITSNELYYCLKHNCRCLHAVALAMTIYLYDMASFNCNTFNSKLIDALTVSSDNGPEWTHVHTGSQTHTFPKNNDNDNNNSKKNHKRKKKNLIINKKIRKKKGKEMYSTLFCNIFVLQ